MWKWIAVGMLPLLMGCNSNPSSSLNGVVLRDQTITAAGLERHYHLFEPAEPTNAPVVFLFHGHGGDYDQMVGFNGRKAPHKIWLDIADRENLIVVVPNGTIGSDDDRGWNDCRSDIPVGLPVSDDVAFVHALLDFVEATYQSDTRRVYVTGTSNGGHFSFRLAQEMPERIAAIAPVVAAMSANSKCPDSQMPVSTLIMNGTADTFVPYEGGQIISNRGEVLSVDDMVTYWVARNNITSAPVITDFDNLNIDDESTVNKSLYPNEQTGHELAIYRIDGGGHTEPSIAEPKRYGTFLSQSLDSLPTRASLSDRLDRPVFFCIPQLFRNDLREHVSCF